MTKRWLAFDVGCIECGEASGVIGVYLTKAAAEVAADRVREAQDEDWHGQHSMDVYEITIPDGASDES